MILLTDTEAVPATGLRRGHLADLEVIEAVLLSDPRRDRVSGYDVTPQWAAKTLRTIIDNPELHNPNSFGGVAG